MNNEDTSANFDLDCNDSDDDSKDAFGMIKMIPISMTCMTLWM